MRLGATSYEAIADWLTDEGVPTGHTRPRASGRGNSWRPYCGTCPKWPAAVLGGRQQAGVRVGQAQAEGQPAAAGAEGLAGAGLLYDRRARGATGGHERRGRGGPPGPPDRAGEPALQRFAGPQPVARAVHPLRRVRGLVLPVRRGHEVHERAGEGAEGLLEPGPGPGRPGARVRAATRSQFPRPTSRGA